MTQTAAINHPDYRPGRGERSTDRQIRLHNEAADAFRVWAVIWSNRNWNARNPKAPRPLYEGIKKDALDRSIAEGGLRGALFTLAHTDATARPLLPAFGYSRTDWDADRFADYDIAGKLAAAYEVAVAPPVSLVPAGYAEETTCRHGRKFSDECAECADCDADA